MDFKLSNFFKHESFEFSLPYSLKRNNYSSGISLTNRLDLFSCSVLSLLYRFKLVNQARRRLTAEVVFVLPLFTLLDNFKNNNNKSSLCSQTYTLNKNGLKLFLFQEYGLYMSLMKA